MGDCVDVVAVSTCAEVESLRAGQVFVLSDSVVGFEGGARVWRVPELLLGRMLECCSVSGEGGIDSACMACVLNGMGTPLCGHLSCCADSFVVCFADGL